MSGFNFVRRYGFPRCRNGKERRFIQSLAFAYSSQTDHYINPGFTVNRKFIYDMFAWVFMLITLIVLFSPFRLNTATVVSCSQPINGTITCTRITVPISAKFATPPPPPSSTTPKNLITTASTVKPATSPPVVTISPIPPAVTTRAPITPAVATLAPKPPAVLTLPPIPPAVITLPPKPPTAATLPPKPPTAATLPPKSTAKPVPLPACTRIVPLDPSNRIKEWKNTVDTYEHYVDSDHSYIHYPQICVKGAGTLKLHPYPAFGLGNPSQAKPYWDLDLKKTCLYSCSTGYVQPQFDDTMRDDCGNLPFTTDTSLLPKKALVDVAVDPTRPKENANLRWQCCCYEYDFYTDPRGNPDRPFHESGCHMRTKEEVKSACINNPNRGCVQIVPGKPRDPSECN